MTDRGDLSTPTAVSSSEGELDESIDGNQEKAMADEKPGVGDRLAQFLNPIMAAVIGFIVLGLFTYAIARTLLATGDAPVAADPANGLEGFSAFDRSVQVVGLVSPVLTIVLGFYFGARVGAAGAEAAKTRADEAQAASTAKDKAIAHIEAMAETGQDESVSDAIDSARTRFPDAF
jgi:hypothetical protein